jgi:hypothetical protein
MKKVLLVLAPVVFVMMTTSSAMMATGCGGGGSGGSGGGGGAGGGTADAGLSTTCDANPNAETSSTVYSKIHAACDSCHSQCPSGAGCSYGDYGDATKMYTSMVGTGTGHVSIYGSEFMVKPNDLAHSTVYLKTGCTPITNPDCVAPDGTHIGAAMPQGGPNAVTADQLKAIKDWICRGAPM